MNFKTTHKLDFEVSEDKISNMLWEKGNPNHFYRFRVGACEGLWNCIDDAYQILAIKNDEKGNGHLTDVFEWFEMSCKRDEKKLRVLHVWNDGFKKHLIGSRGFIAVGIEDVEKTFTNLSVWRVLKNYFLTKLMNMKLRLKGLKFSIEIDELDIQDDDAAMPPADSEFSPFRSMSAESVVGICQNIDCNNPVEKIDGLGINVMCKECAEKLSLKNASEESK